MLANQTLPFCSVDPSGCPRVSSRASCRESKLTEPVARLKNRFMAARFVRNIPSGSKDAFGWAKRLFPHHVVKKLRSEAPCLKTRRHHREQGGAPSRIVASQKKNAPQL